MRSPLFGLMYFTWLRTRLAVLCLVAACIAIPSIFHATVVLFGAHFEASSVVLIPDLSLAIDGCLIIAVGAILFGLIETEGDSISYRSSRYLTTMPVRTSLLAKSFMLYTVLVAAIMSCGIAAIHAHLFGHGYLVDEALLRKFPLICVSVVLWIQSTLVLVGIANEILIGVFGICVWGAGVASLILFASGKYAPLGMVLCFALIPISYGVSYVGIAGFRSSRWQSITPWLTEKFSAGVFRTTPFETAESALSWYVWRRYCRPIIIGFACGGPPALLLGFLLHKYGTPPPKPIPFWHFCPAVLVYLLAVTGACTVGQNVFEITRGTSFLIVQPARSACIARGLLLPLAATLVLIFALAAPCVFVVSHFLPPPHIWNKVLSIESFAVIGACMAVPWIGMCYGFFLIPLVILTAISALLCYFLLGIREPSTYVWAFDISLLVLSAGSLVFGWHKRYLERRSVIAMLIAWSLGLFAAQIVAMQLHADPAVLLPPPSSVPVIHKIAENATPHVIPIAALALLYTTALFAALPFIHLPALIDHYRHR